MTNGIHDKRWASRSLWKNTTDDAKFSGECKIQIRKHIDPKNVESAAKCIISE